MTIQSRYSGTCPDCGERWQEGDSIESKFARGIWRHVTCPDAPDPLEAEHPVCPVCFLTHPIGRCDRD